MRPLDLRIMDYLFWLKFAWSVWSEIRSAKLPTLGVSAVPFPADPASDPDPIE